MRCGCGVPLPVSRLSPREPQGPHPWAAETHCSSLTKPVAAVWEVRQGPDTSRRRPGGPTQTSVSTLPTRLAWVAGTEHAGPRGPGEESAPRRASVSHRQRRVSHSFRPSFIPPLPEPTVHHTEPELPETHVQQGPQRTIPLSATEEGVRPQRPGGTRIQRGVRRGPHGEDKATRGIRTPWAHDPRLTVAAVTA